MIVYDRITDYLDVLSPGNSAIIEEIRKKALEDDIPIIRRGTEDLLKTLIALTKPKKILEIGTAVAYSSIIMAEYMPEGSHISTIENYEPRWKDAEANVQSMALADKIELLHGDATDILDELHESYDFVFMDAAKAQYLNWLPKVKKLMKSGSILLSDNVLQDGDVVESRYAITRRDRTIHNRMRDYLYALTHDDDLQTSIVPVGDGVAISVYR